MKKRLELVKGLNMGEEKDARKKCIVNLPGLNN